MRVSSDTRYFNIFYIKSNLFLEKQSINNCFLTRLVFHFYPFSLKKRIVRNRRKSRVPKLRQKRTHINARTRDSGSSVVESLTRLFVEHAGTSRVDSFNLKEDTVFVRMLFFLIIFFTSNDDVRMPVARLFEFVRLK